MNNKELYNRLQAVYNELVDIAETVADNPEIIGWSEPTTGSHLTPAEYEGNPFANETGDWKPVYSDNKDNYYDIHKSIEYLEQVSKRLNGVE